MVGYAKRTGIAVLCFVLFVYVLPLLFSVLTLPLGADLFQLLKICAAVVALGYIIFGNYPN